MVGPGIDLQLRDLLTRKAVLGEHSLDGHTDDLFRPTIELLAQGAAPQAARVVRVPEVTLLVELVPGHLDLLRVHDDHEVTGIDVRGELRLALAAKRLRNSGRQAAERLPVGVHDVPLAGDLTWLGGIRLHPWKRWTSRPPARNRSSPARNSAAPP